MEEKHLIAYFSGYFDGDGCIRIGKTIQQGIIVYERSLTITSVKKEPIMFFMKYFGGIYRMEKIKRDHKPQHTWTVKNKNAKRNAEIIKNYLIVKQKQCENFIKFCNVITPNYFIAVQEQIIKERDRLINANREDIHKNDLISKEFVESIKILKNTVNPTELDYAYFAGLIDAEGCFRVVHRVRKSSQSTIYNTCLEIGNTKASMIKWLIERFGGSLCYCINPGIRSKKMCRWSIGSKALKEIIPKIAPYLINKKDVCNEIINFQKTILKNGGRRSSQKFKEHFKSICLQRQVIINKIHNLNKKGSKV